MVPGQCAFCLLRFTNGYPVCFCETRTRRSVRVKDAATRDEERSLRRAQHLAAASISASPALARGTTGRWCKKVGPKIVPPWPTIFRPTFLHHLPVLFRAPRRPTRKSKAAARVLRAAQRTAPHRGLGVLTRTRRRLRVFAESPRHRRSVKRRQEKAHCPGPSRYSSAPWRDRFSGGGMNWRARRTSCSPSARACRISPPDRSAVCAGAVDRAETSMRSMPEGRAIPSCGRRARIAARSVRPRAGKRRPPGNASARCRAAVAQRRAWKSPAGGDVTLPYEAK